MLQIRIEIFLVQKVIKGPSNHQLFGAISAIWQNCRTDRKEEEEGGKLEKGKSTR